MATETGNGGLEGLWLSVSELARQRSITKGPLSRQVSRLEEQGLLATRPGERGSKLINVAEFDRVTKTTTDGVRKLNGTGTFDEQPPAGGAPQNPTGPSLSSEQMRRASYDADLKKLDLDERLGRVVPIADVEAAMINCAEKFVQAISQLPGRADDISAAIAKDGTAGVRRILKEIAFDLRAKVGQSMRLLADGAKQTESDDVQE